MAKRCACCGALREHPPPLRWEPFGNSVIAQVEGWTLYAYESGSWHVHGPRASMAGNAGDQEAAKLAARDAFALEWRQGKV